MRGKIIKIGIVLLTVIAMLGIWPGKLIKREVENKSNATTYYDTSPITENNCYRQNFIPKQKYIESISIQLNRDSTMNLTNEGILTIRLYNENDEVCAETSEEVKKIVNKDYYALTLNTRVEPDRPYYFTISVRGCEGAGPTIKYGNISEIGLEENTSIYFDATDYPQFSTVCIYQYKIDLTLWDVLTYYSFILFIAMLFICEGSFNMLYYREKFLRSK